MLGFPILYCKGMRPMMFQLSGFCYTSRKETLTQKDHPVCSQEAKHMSNDSFATTTLRARHAQPQSKELPGFGVFRANPLGLRL